MSTGDSWTATNISYDGSHLTVTVSDPANGQRNSSTALNNYPIDLASLLGQNTGLRGLHFGNRYGWRRTMTSAKYAPLPSTGPRQGKQRQGARRPASVRPARPRGARPSDPRRARRPLVAPPRRDERQTSKVAATHQRGPKVTWDSTRRRQAVTTAGGSSSASSEIAHAASTASTVGASSRSRAIHRRRSMGCIRADLTGANAGVTPMELGGVPPPIVPQPTMPPLVMARTSRARSTSSSVSRPISSTTVRRSFPPATAALTTLAACS